VFSLQRIEAHASQHSSPHWNVLVAPRFCLQRIEDHANQQLEANLGMLVTAFPDMGGNLERLRSALPPLTQLLFKDVGESLFMSSLSGLVLGLVLGLGFGKRPKGVSQNVNEFLRKKEVFSATPNTAAPQGRG
jgi:hypothetical protein